jgi:hypothetical protein
MGFSRGCAMDVAMLAMARTAKTNLKHWLFADE